MNRKMRRHGRNTSGEAKPLTEKQQALRKSKRKIAAMSRKKNRR